MPDNPQIRINLTANTPAFAAVTAEVNAMGRAAKDTSAYVAATGRNMDSLRPAADRAGQAVRQVGNLWERARNTVSRLPNLISRSSRETDNLARNAKRAKVELQDATEASRNLQQALGIGLGVNLVDRVMQATISGPQMLDHLVQRGLDYNARMETGALRFEQLLGSAEAARAKMQELSDFAATTPFELPGLVEGAIALQSLTRGALSARDGLTLVGDAAALAERPFEEISVHIARVWDGLQNNRPVGMSMMRLQELGLVTGDVRARIEALQKAGARGNEVWAIMEEQLRKASGQMDKLSASSAGLEANLNDIQDATLGQITVPVFEARNKGMAELIKAMEEIDLTPLVALGETWANAVKLGYDFQEYMVRNSGLVAAVVRVGGAIVAGATITATVRATRALVASYAAWVRANYAQSAFGRQATVTASQTAAQTAALNANTIAVNNNAIAKRSAAAATLAANNAEMMSAGRRTAWQLQNAGAAPAARQARGFSPLRGAGALVGGGALAGGLVATAGLAVGVEWLMAEHAAHARKGEDQGNALAQQTNNLLEQYRYPAGNENRDEAVEELSAQMARLEKNLKNRRAPRSQGRAELGGTVLPNFDRPPVDADLTNVPLAEIEDNISALRQRLAELDDLTQEQYAANAEAAAEAARIKTEKALSDNYNAWLRDNSEDIDKEFAKTRLSILDDAERLIEIRERLRSGPAGLAKSEAVDVDVSGKSARELTQEVLPALQAQLEQLEATSFDHTRLQVAIQLVREWATELKALESEMGTLEARAASNAATAEDLRLEREIAAARLAGNDALVEELEHKRELLKVEQQIDTLVKNNVMTREEAASVLKGMVEDARKLAAQEKARAQTQALRDEAGELAVLQLRAKGLDDEAEKLERRIRLEKEAQEVVKATGRDEQWARAHLEARYKLEDKIKERRDAESKSGKDGAAARRPERNWRINQSGKREYRTEDGRWLRPEDMTHQQRVAAGAATFVRDGAAAVGMQPGAMDIAEDRYLGRNAFAPAAPSTADAAFAAINSIAPGIVPAPATLAPVGPVAPTAVTPAQSVDPVAPSALPPVSALPAAAARVTTAADGVAGEVAALASVVEAGFERIGAAVSSADQSLSQRIEAVAAQVKANRN